MLKLIFTSIFGTVCLFLLTNSVTAQDTSQKKQLVQQRILSDIDSLRNQIAQLNKSVNNLQKKVNDLKRQNQNLRGRVNDLQRKLDSVSSDQRETGNSGNQLDQTKMNTDQQSSSDGESRKKTKSGGIQTEPNGTIWTKSPHLDYQIRREPLDYEVIYVTTDDTTLTRLAHRYYRNASLWKQIYEANRDKLPSPDVVPPNVRLRLPPVNELN